jgi:ribosomal protein S3
VKRLLTALMLTLVVATSGDAHEGHDQKIMGTVATIRSGQIQVKATNGKTVVIVLNAKTKVVMGRMAHKIADIKEGNRVVVTATDVKDKSGKTTLVAKQVALAAAPATTARK